MSHKERRWVNPYIDRIDTLPETLIGSEKDGLDQNHIDAILVKIRTFSSCYFEIGSGSGAHLVERAIKDPGSLYMGVELRYKRAFKTAEKAVKAGALNLIAIRGDANIVTEVIPANTLAGVYINFPDPWAKKRWNKNRIINPKNLLLIHQRLAANGFLAFKTDHREYFESAVSIIEETGLFKITEVTRDLYESPYCETNVPTEFENLFKSKGLSPCYLRAIKISPEV
jgi:tRNA (guanine-N7-)-methyltransferase